MVLPPPADSKKKVRKHLSADALFALVGGSFAQVPDPRRPNSLISLPDALMSAFAMFSLKAPSLLAFDQRRSDGNLKTLFGIGQIPSDTQMREILDEVAPEHLRDTFRDVFRQLQRGKALEPFDFYAGAYLLSLDGTGYFSSPTIHCDSCQVKGHKDGTVSYQHQMLGAVIVHPDIKAVIPLAPEPIQKQAVRCSRRCGRSWGASARCGTICVLIFAMSALAQCGNSTKRSCMILPKKCRSLGWTVPNAPAARQ